MSTKSHYKKYGFINFFDRWTTDTMTQFGTSAFPTTTTKLKDDYFKMNWGGQFQSDGTRAIKYFFTQKKDTDFRNLMNKTLNQAIDSDEFIAQINACCLYNRVDSAYGVSAANHGDCLMGDLFDFDGSDYSLTYQLNYNIGANKLARLKTIGLINADNTIDNPLANFRPANACEITFQSDMNDKRSVCVNFIPTNVAARSDFKSNWNQKGYFNPTSSDNTVITKLGATTDILVPLNDFTCVKDTNVSLEFGRPVKLVSDSVTLTDRSGFIIHVYD